MNNKSFIFRILFLLIVFSFFSFFCSNAIGQKKETENDQVYKYKREGFALHLFCKFKISKNGDFIIPTGKYLGVFCKGDPKSGREGFSIEIPVRWTPIHYMDSFHSGRISFQHFARFLKNIDLSKSQIRKAQEIEEAFSKKIDQIVLLNAMHIRRKSSDIVIGKLSKKINRWLAESESKTFNLLSTPQKRKFWEMVIAWETRNGLGVALLAPLLRNELEITDQQKREIEIVQNEVKIKIEAVRRKYKDLILRAKNRNADGGKDILTNAQLKLVDTLLKK